MVVQQIIVDREATTADKLLNATSTQFIPQVLTAGGALKGFSLGNGLVKYRTNATQTASAVNQPIIVPKAHRFVRLESVLVTASTGALDATGLNEALGKINNDIGANPNTIRTLFSTNGSQAVSSIEFVGGLGWEEDACTYVITSTADNTSQLFHYFYIQYL